MSEAHNPYGDGKASKRIVDEIISKLKIWLKGKNMKSIVDLNFDWNLIPNPTTEKEKSIVEIAELIYKDYFFENTF